MIVLRLARHPTRLDSVHPQVIEDMLELAKQQQPAVDMIVEMLKDFGREGSKSRFVKKLKGPLWELKSRARGGMRGGARVYFFWTEDGDAVVCAAECKTDEHPDLETLNRCAEIYVAYKYGKKVF